VSFKHFFLRKVRRTPLGNTLPNGSEAAPSRSGGKSIFIGALLILLVPYIGSSLAASITISGRSGGGAVEFAQGSQVTVVCDTEIITSLDEEWYDAGVIFRVSKIRITGILNTAALTATSNNGGCGDKTLTVKIFASGSQQVIGTGGSSENFVSFIVPKTGASSGAVSLTNATGMTGASTVALSNTDIVLTLSSSINIDANGINRIAVETS
jgi:hypothetical protein